MGMTKGRKKSWKPTGLERLNQSFSVRLPKGVYEIHDDERMRKYTSYTWVDELTVETDTKDNQTESEKWVDEWLQRSEDILPADPTAEP